MNTRIPSVLALLTLVTAFSLALISCAKQTPAPGAVTDAEKIARGRYLTVVAGCNDCHTPGYLYGVPDTTRLLSGSELGWKGPWGVSYARNLTPDPQTGIGAWSETDIVTAIRTGRRPDGRMLMPPMPWTDFASLTDDDAVSIAKYLKSIPPVPHKMPDILGPDATPTGSIIAFPPPSAWDAPRAPGVGAPTDTTAAKR
jgi:mono/diheme cytochrome c family protein